MKEYENLIKIFIGAEIDGLYLSSTVIKINFYNSLLINENEVNSFWLNFDCNAHIYTVNEDNFTDHLTQDVDFVSVLYTLIGSEVKSATIENEKLILTFIDSGILEIFEDLNDDNDEVWNICSSLESSYGEYLFAYFKGDKLKFKERL